MFDSWKPIPIPEAQQDITSGAYEYIADGTSYRIVFPSAHPVPGWDVQLIDYLTLSENIETKLVEIYNRYPRNNRNPGEPL